MIAVKCGYATQPVTTSVANQNRHHVVFYFTSRVVYAAHAPHPSFLLTAPQLVDDKAIRLSRSFQCKIIRKNYRHPLILL